MEIILFGIYRWTYCPLNKKARLCELVWLRCFVAPVAYGRLDSPCSSPSRQTSREPLLRGKSRHDANIPAAELPPPASERRIVRARGCKTWVGCRRCPRPDRYSRESLRTQAFNKRSRGARLRKRSGMDMASSVRMVRSTMQQDRIRDLETHKTALGRK